MFNINICLKLWPKNRFKYLSHFSSDSLINKSKKLSTIDNKTEDQNQNNTKITSKEMNKVNPRRRLITDPKLLDFEHQFQEQRSGQLSPIGAKDYKQWLTKHCLDSNQSPLNFERKYRIIESICETYNHLMGETVKVPTHLTTDMMAELLDMYLSEEITKQIQYLYELELIRFTRKALRKQEVMANKVRLDLKNKGNVRRIGIFGDNNEIMYGLWHNTLFTRLKLQCKKNYISRTRLKTSALFGQQLVIDFSFEDYLNKISAKELSSDFHKLFLFNKYRLKNSFDLTFSSFNSSGIISKALIKHLKKPLNECFITVKPDSYLNHYDFDRLCYICPQADEPLTEYNPNTVYILPGVVHHLMNPSLSMMRVRREGIEMRRIPVIEFAPKREDFHLELSNTLQILSHFRDYHNMSEALDLYLPKYIWKTAEECEDEDQEVINKLFYQQMIGSQRKTKVYHKIED